VVNVTDLLILAPESRHPHALSKDKFVELFTRDRPVLFNYHWYAVEQQGLLVGQEGVHRMKVQGYC
jgi:xylulose-5-phosphate/fructose-6-phosphate phosphoketolase